eukprot:4183196-Alexandrium_andersonii.AAC.1
MAPKKLTPENLEALGKPETLEDCQTHETNRWYCVLLSIGFVGLHFRKSWSGSEPSRIAQPRAASSMRRRCKHSGSASSASDPSPRVPELGLNFKSSLFNGCAVRGLWCWWRCVWFGVVGMVDVVGM